jgi:ankyrin repeat protein
MALLEKGADVQAKNSDGVTPLLWACDMGLSEVAMALLEKGADVQAKNSHGVTPLHWACEKGHIDIAAMLRVYCAVD